MKNIKFLVLILSLIALRINAYDYLIYKYPAENLMRFFSDENDKSLKICVTRNNGEVIRYNDFSSEDTYLFLNRIKNNFSFAGVTYTHKATFDNWLKTDLQFLNDFYVQHTNYILNYLYNDDDFSNSNHKNYRNYEILYNKNGLAVASKFNNEWAGLYNNETIKNSGNLYNKNGLKEYQNGKYVGGLNNVFGYDIAEEFCKQIKQGFGLIGGLGVGLFITLLAISACIKYIKYKDGLYSNGIKEDKKLMRDIKTEANVLAFRTITGINSDKTPDSVWTTYMKDDNELSPLDRERKRQYTDVMQRNYEKWKDKMQ